MLYNFVLIHFIGKSAEVMFRCSASVGSRSLPRDIHSKAVIVFQLKQNHLFMLCANFTHSDPVTYALIMTHLNISFKCSLYYDTLIIQIHLVVAEIVSVNCRQIIFQQRPHTEATSCHVKFTTADSFPYRLIFKPCVWFVVKPNKCWKDLEKHHMFSVYIK